MITGIAPIPSRRGSRNRVVAPISTVLFVPNSHRPGDGVPGLEVPKESNLPSDKHWSDVAPAGSVVFAQQGEDAVGALVGDIVATRLKVRGVLGVFADGHTRDIVGIAEVCEGASFQAWSKSLISAGTSTSDKPWAVDVPLKIGKVVVQPGDIICADEGEMVSCVIPRDKLDEVLELLPKQKEADNGLLKDVQEGMDFKEAIKRHPDHYSVGH